MKNKLIFPLALAGILAAALTALALVIGLIYTLRTDRAEVTYNGGCIYIGIQHEYNPLKLKNSPETLRGFQSIYDALEALPFDYYEIYHQPLDCSASEGMFYGLYSAEASRTCEWADSVQISRNVQEDFSLNVTQGHSLDDSDFQHGRGQAVPVLMGYDYSGIYGVGDRFSAKYLFSEFTFEIVGLLDKGCAISTSALYIPLDNVVVLPSLAFIDPPQSSREYTTQKIHLANKTSGKLKVRAEDFGEAYGEVQEIVSESVVGSYSVSASSLRYILKEDGTDLGIILALAAGVHLTGAAGAYLLGRRWHSPSPRRRYIVCGAIAAAALFASSALAEAPLACLGLTGQLVLPYLACAAAAWGVILCFSARREPVDDARERAECKRLT